MKLPQHVSDDLAQWRPIPRPTLERMERVVEDAMYLWAMTIGRGDEYQTDKAAHLVARAEESVLLWHATNLVEEIRNDH